MEKITNENDYEIITDAKDIKLIKDYTCPKCHKRTIDPMGQGVGGVLNKTGKLKEPEWRFFHCSNNTCKGKFKISNANWQKR